MLFALTISALLCFNLATAQNFDSMRSDCRKNHADRLNECIVRAIGIYKRQLIKGIPESNIPSLDPMRLNNFNLTQSEGRVTIQGQYTDIVVTGAGKFDLKYLDINYDEENIRFGVTVPALSARGKYEMDGRVFDMPVRGKGNFRAIFAGLVLQGMGHVVQRGNRRIIGKIDLEFKIRDIKAKVDNLFEGNTVLTDTLDHFLRENGDLVLEEIRPMLTRRLNELMEVMMNLALSPTADDTLSYVPNANTKDKHRQTTLRNAANKRQQANQG